MKTIPQPSGAVHVGVDVAKATLQADLQGKPLSLTNDKAGHKRLLAALPAGSIVTLESTGSYHLALTRMLQAHDVAVNVINPARVLHFARAQGTLAKTDPKDAVSLSEFGEALAAKLRPAPPADPQRVLLKELVNLRETLVAEITRWGNLIEHQQSAICSRFARAQREAARRALKRLEQQIAVLLKASPAFAPVAAVLGKCPGIGPVTTAVLVAEMAELGKINRCQAAALAGLAPHPKESGTLHGIRRIHGGRPRLKRALYLAALSAVRHHPVLKPFYQSLRLKGKPAKVALVAVARRLIVILNAKLKEHYSEPAPEP